MVVVLDKCAMVFLVNVCGYLLHYNLIVVNVLLVVKRVAVEVCFIDVFVCNGIVFVVVLCIVCVYGYCFCDAVVVVDDAIIIYSSIICVLIVKQ